ncbi:MAG: DUF3488 and transglutaminase-like domain-containing protein [Caldimicrobium sp.]|nr:DUF3488 and transglutaminase-like domain-containing protein [Caldimicrobium sp.]MDW8093967.1 DUF3488 and transglutaminase-like domain-containing protein [Caldimicrobium sp.]MDW8183124.1 DUF3488 and transglutaminase-like domain-containing protein [Caldimicrobium sp.]
MEKTKLERLLLMLSLLIPFGLNFTIVDRKFYLLAVGLGLLAIFLESRNFHIPRFVINALGVVFILFFFFTVTLANFLDNALITLFLLLSLKLFEKKRLRDYFQIYLLEFLILAGTSFFYTSIWFFLLLLLQVFLIGISLFIHLYMEEGEVAYVSGVELKSMLFCMGTLLTGSIILAGIFFISLPRLQAPLLKIAGAESDKAKTGFTEKIRLGAFSEIQESSKVILRFNLKAGKLPDASSIYIRAIVYDHFDGKTWERKESVLLSSRPLLERKGQHYGATLYLQEDLQDYLPTLDYTFHLRANYPFREHRDGVYKLGEMVSYPLKYEISFSPETRLVEETSEIGAYLQIPDVSPRIRKLAQSLRGGSDGETLNKIVEYFHKAPFRYSLKRLPQGEDPLDRFLFESKEGNCEFFAGATALLLRLNGIPARVIGGYRGAVYHERGGYYLVQERFAHSWVEALINGQWVRVDPSPQASFNILSKERKSLQRLKLYADLINFYYVKFILDYDVTKQKKLWHFLGTGISNLLGKKENKSAIKDLSDLKGFSFLGVLGCVLISVLGIILLIKFRGDLWDYLEVFKKPEKRLFRRFERELKKRGYVREKGAGLWEFVESIRDSDLKFHATRFAQIYSSYYYKDEPFDKKAIEELEKCLKKLRELK